MVCVHNDRFKIEYCWRLAANSKTMAETCAGTVLASGKPCTVKAVANGLCNKHQSQIFLIDAKRDGKYVCRMFPRGCRNYIHEGEKTCDSCKDKLSQKAKSCEHEGCKYKVTNESERFCGKHVRDVYREKEAAGEVRYCNVDRGCVSILHGDEKRCKICCDSKIASVAKDLKQRRDAHILCVACGISSKTTDYFCEPCSKRVVLDETNKYTRTLDEAWHDFRHGAIKRELIITVNYDDFVALAIKPCYYCGVYQSGACNGVDRIDNNKGYISTNVVPCCTMCNMMKNDQSIEALYEKINVIVGHQVTGESIRDALVEKWYNVYCVKTKHYTFESYTYVVTKKRKLAFELSKEQYTALVHGECYLCGIKTSAKHFNGIDRVDPKQGYTLENCRTCCGHCNFMKRNFTLEDFLQKCKQIVHYYKPLHMIDAAPSSEPQHAPAKEIYRSQDIYEILFKSTPAELIAWGKREDKSTEFIEALRSIDIRGTEKSVILCEIKHQLELERKRRFANTEPKYITGVSMYAQLINGEKDTFISTYTSMYDITPSFNSQLDNLICCLALVERSHGIDMCKKFLKAESLRRQSSRNTQIKHNLRAQKERAEWTAKTVPSTIAPVVPPTVNTVNTLCDSAVDVTTCRDPAVITDDTGGTAAVKQWKAIDAYVNIRTRNGEEFRKHCEEHNELTPAWDSEWTTFFTSVKDIADFKDAKDSITAFIANLRSQRHRKLTQKDVLVRTDRESWPAETIAKAFAAGKMDDVKIFYESKDTVGNNWIARWSKLLKDLSEEDDVTKQIAIIQKFQRTHRTVCCRIRATTGAGTT